MKSRLSDVTGAPETRYAKTSDGVNIAYQVLGDGPFDVVFIPGWISHLDLDAGNPFMRRFFDVGRCSASRRAGP